MNSEFVQDWIVQVLEYHKLNKKHSRSCLVLLKHDKVKCYWMDTFLNKFEPPNSFLGKSNSSRRHRKVQNDDDTGVDNAVNSAVYSTLIFIPGIIGFIFVCIRTHRKSKLEKKQLRELERRKLSLRDDDIT